MNYLWHIYLWSTLPGGMALEEGRRVPRKEMPRSYGQRFNLQRHGFGASRFLEQRQVR